MVLGEQSVGATMEIAGDPADSGEERLIKTEGWRQFTGEVVKPESLIESATITSGGKVYARSSVGVIVVPPDIPIGKKYKIVLVEESDG